MKIKINAQTEWEKWRVKTFYDKEPETIAWIANFEPEGTVFWDIGANIGIYTLFCAYTHPQMVIHAFEPFRTNFIKLWENIFLNNFALATAHFVAVDKSDGFATFKQPMATAGTSGGRINSTMANPACLYEVPTAAGDSLARTCGWPDYIKIDTDGNEYEIVCGLKKVLKHPRLKSVLVEVNDHAAEMFKIMGRAGFKPDAVLNAYKNRASDHNVIFTRNATKTPRR